MRGIVEFAQKFNCPDLCLTEHSKFTYNIVKTGLYRYNEVIKMKPQEMLAHISGDRTETTEQHLKFTAETGVKLAEGLGITEIIRLICLLHDMGKLCTAFNDYIHGNGGYKRGDIDHCYAGAKYILSLAEPPQNDAALFIARVILSHHSLHDWLKDNGTDYIKQRTSKDEFYDEIVAAYEILFPKEETCRLLEKATEEYKAVIKKIAEISKPAPDKSCLYKRLSFYSGMFERLAASILIDADRINAAAFNYDTAVPQPISTEQLWQTMADNITAECARLSHKQDEITAARADISQRCAAFAEHRVKVTRLIVPTGGGKTLSSMRFAANYCKKFGCGRIIYTAPFMSILEQNSDILRRLTDNENFYLEHHSNFIPEPDSDCDELSDYQYHTERWDSPVISTTLVQLLNTMFSSRTCAVRRFHRLCNAVIIIDEVQSLPLKCVRLFNLAINFLSHVCSAAVVLCSATQPPFDGDRQFPLLIDEQGSMTGDFAADFERFRRTKLVNLTRTQGYTYSEAAEFCLEQLAKTGSVLFITNTKDAARQIYHKTKQLTQTEADLLIIHLSTAMCPQHRRKAMDKLRSALSEGRRVICITTQLIEAGVDISFRCVIRSLAGLDNAAQAAGRCNRNGQYPCCDTYIINLCDENLGQLYEIKCAQNASREAFYRCGDSDLLSPDSMSAFYSALFRERKQELSYPAEDCGAATDLIDMLSFSTVRCGLKKIPLGALYRLPLSAGRIFEVIDSVTQSVIVPYNDEARGIIADLTSCGADKLLYSRLRKAQIYSVGLYPQQLERLLKANAIYTAEYGVYILREEYYSDEFGVTEQARPMQALVY